MCFCSENEKKCTLDQAFRVVVEEEIVSILNAEAYLLLTLTFLLAGYYINVTATYFSVRKHFIKNRSYVMVRSLRLNTDASRR